MRPTSKRMINEWNTRAWRYGESACFELLKECPKLGVLYVSHYAPDIYGRRNATGQYVVMYPTYGDAVRL